MIPNTNLTMPSSTANTVCHQYKPAINATIGTTINDLFFKILANLQETAPPIAGLKKLKRGLNAFLGRTSETEKAFVQGSYIFEYVAQHSADSFHLYGPACSLAVESLPNKVTRRLHIPLRHHNSRPDAEACARIVLAVEGEG